MHWFDACVSANASDLSSTTLQKASVSQWKCLPTTSNLVLSGTSGSSPEFSKSMRGLVAVNFTSTSSTMRLNVTMNSYNSCGIVTFQLPPFATGATGTINLVSEGTDGVNVYVNIGTRLLILAYNGVTVQSQTLSYMQSTAGGYVYTAVWRAVDLQARLWVYYENRNSFQRAVLVNATYTAIGAKTTKGVVSIGGANAGCIHEVRIYPYAVAEADLLVAVKQVDDTYSGAPINVHRIRVYRSWTSTYEFLNIAGITAYDASNVALAFVGGSVKWAYQVMLYDWNRLTDGNATTFAVSDGATSTGGTLLEAWNEVWVEARSFTKIIVNNRSDNNLQSRIVGCRLQVFRNNGTTWEDITLFDAPTVATTYEFLVNIS